MRTLTIRAPATTAPPNHRVGWSRPVLAGSPPHTSPHRGRSHAAGGRAGRAARRATAGRPRATTTRPHHRQRARAQPAGRAALDLQAPPPARRATHRRRAEGALAVRPGDGQGGAGATRRHSDNERGTVMRALSTLSSRRGATIGALGPIHARPARTNIGAARPAGRFARARRAAAELPRRGRADRATCRGASTPRHSGGRRGACHGARSDRRRRARAPPRPHPNVGLRQRRAARRDPGRRRPRPRLRFDLETAKQALLARRRRDEPLPAPETPRPTPRRRRPSAPPPVPLLPIHERRALGAFARRHLRAPQRPLDMPHPARIPTAPRRIILGQQRETPPHRANGRGPDTGDCAPMPAKKPSHAPEHWFGLPKRGA